MNVGSSVLIFLWDTKVNLNVRLVVNMAAWAVLTWHIKYEREANVR